MDLSGKTVVITGASGVLGSAVARKANELGAKLVLLDIVFTDSASAFSDAQKIVVDLSDLHSTQRCFDQIGTFDALCNLAGGFDMGTPVHATSDEQWDFLFKVNVTTLRNAIKAGVPILLKGGHGAIVNVGALGAEHGAENMGTYCATKSVVMRLTESMAKELKVYDVRVNAVLPSVIDTPRNRADMPDADVTKWVDPNDLANVICFLISDAASAVSGALVPVSGRG